MASKNSQARIQDWALARKALSQIIRHGSEAAVELGYTKECTERPSLPQFFNVAFLLSRVCVERSVNHCCLLSY